MLILMVSKVYSIGPPAGGSAKKQKHNNNNNNNNNNRGREHGEGVQAVQYSVTTIAMSDAFGCHRT